MTTNKTISDTLNNLESASKEELNKYIADIEHGIVTKINNLIGERKSLKDFDSFPAEYRYLYAIRQLSDEVFNGGYEQFIINGKMFCVKSAIEGLREIGLDKLADVTLMAMSEFIKSRFEPKTKIEKPQDMADLYKEFKSVVNLDKYSKMYYESYEKINGKVVDYIFNKKDILKSISNDTELKNIITKSYTETDKFMSEFMGGLK